MATGAANFAAQLEPVSEDRQKKLREAVLEQILVIVRPERKAKDKLAVHVHFKFLTSSS